VTRKVVVPRLPTTDRENRCVSLKPTRNCTLEPHQLANSLYPLIEEGPLESILNSFQTDYEADYASMMRNVRSLRKRKMTAN
jgi:hypothetical protein